MDLMTYLDTQMDYSHPESSFSPFFSDIGLGIGEQGIDRLYLHYNRCTCSLGEPFLAVEPSLKTVAADPYAVHQKGDGAEAKIAFYQRNSWLIDATHTELALNVLQDPNFDHFPAVTLENEMIYHGFMQTGDRRDPDKRVAVLLGVRVVRGQLNGGVLAPDADGKLLAAFSVELLDGTVDMIRERLARCPDSAAAAIEASRAWYDEWLGGLSLDEANADAAKLQAQCAYSLLSNSCEAPGCLRGRVAAFPSRGRYPTHFLWDSCFQNLGLELMNPELAVDSLLLLIENLRADGKMAHFLCSTWMRPDCSQPPLVGWAGLRLVKRTNDLDLARKLMPALRKNTQWWLTQRMTACGLIRAEDGFETGWDDSPLFDDGPGVACDMNSYLLVQIRACAEMARMVGDPDAGRDEQLAGDLARKMVEVLYDENNNYFWNRSPDGQTIRIKTPASFLPLWAGVPIADDKARAIITDSLLNPDHFFDDIPFPSVAYDEASYQPDRLWRGPTWMPVSWLMLETLQAYGFAAEAQHATARLYAMLLRDGDAREYFNSRTGDGIGARQQGWTAAIALRLAAICADCG